MTVWAATRQCGRDIDWAGRGRGSLQRHGEVSEVAREGRAGGLEMGGGGGGGSDSLNVLPSVVHVPSMARQQAAAQDSKWLIVICQGNCLVAMLATLLPVAQHSAKL